MAFLIALWCLNTLTKLRGAISVDKEKERMRGVSTHSLAAIAALGPFLTLLLYGI